MSTPLVLTESVREEIKHLREFAEQVPVDMKGIEAKLSTPDGKREHRAQMTRQSMEIPMGFLVTFSIEEGHPCGTCRHMSMSVQREDRVPNEHALWIVAQMFGFWGGLNVCSMWPEKLDGHGVAINVVQPFNLREKPNLN